MIILQMMKDMNSTKGSFHNVNNDRKICGIYKIKNTVNNKVYIGQSVDIKSRWQSHRADAFNPNVAQKYKSSLYSAIRKYGIDNFKFEVIEECNRESLNEKEVFWIGYYNSNNPKFGYNMTPGGNNPAELNLTKCYQYNLDGYFIEEFESVVSASEKQEPINRAFLDVAMVI